MLYYRVIKNGRKYFIQTFGKMYENNIRLVVSTMRKPGFLVTFGVSGVANKPSVQTMAKIAKALDVLIEELIK